jgi:hypothetical protein
MGKHRAIVTRVQLIRRYAAATGGPTGAAHDLHWNTDIEVLQDLVESLERTSMQGPFPRRRSFARSQPTTTIKGQTR